MLIVSWNVAGLSTTVNRIHEHISATRDRSECPSSTSGNDGAVSSEQPAKKMKRGSSGSSNSNSNTCSALAEFFDRHRADIVCLQEHKIPKSQLANRTEPRQLSHVPGYESFWSCCVDENSRGMNGVCTYARIGSVVRADPSPLASAMVGGGEGDDGCLNRQGRCIKTDHGEFVLFNVYVPANGGQPLKNKLKFLNALRQAMQQTRQEKPVILVGDLNITHRPLDVYWSDRVVYVNDVIEEVRKYREQQRNQQEQKQMEEQQSTCNGGTTELPAAQFQLPKWKLDVAEHWGRVARVLATLRAVKTTTRNTKTNQEFEKYRAAVTIEDGSNASAASSDIDTCSGNDKTKPTSRQVFLGKHESNETWCLMDYEVLEPWVYVDEATGESKVMRPANVVSVGALVELMNKIAGVVWSDSVRRDIADNYAGVVKEALARQWLDAIVEEDGMVDAFRHFYPEAQSRFTCWNQFTNRRYYNEGMRIDYTLIDRSLLDRVQLGDAKGLRCCGEAGGAADRYQLSEEAALAAVTANGRFQPVSFEGGGIQEATVEALDSQFGPPHTGMIYTPPSFSDHIGISVVLDDALLRTDLVVDSKDPTTKKAQPHKLQTSIASFFGSASGKSQSSVASVQKRASTCSTAVKACVPPQRGSFFGSSGTDNKKGSLVRADGTASKGLTAAPTSSTTSKASSTIRHPTKSSKPPHKNSILNHFQRSGAK